MPPIELPIQDAFRTPSPFYLVRTLITGTFSGSGDLPNPGGLPLVLAYGLTWSFFTVPSGFGRTLGSPVRYTPRMLQLSVYHPTIDLREVLTEYHDFDTEGLYFVFANSTPSRVHYELAPGVVAVFSWLLV